MKYLMIGNLNLMIGNLKYICHLQLHTGHAPGKKWQVARAGAVTCSMELHKEDIMI